MQPAAPALRGVTLADLGLQLGELRLCRPAADERMRRSLERHGQLTAIVVFDDGQRLQLVDGFKRRRAAQRLGWTSLCARVVTLDEATATAIIGTLHEHRRLTELEQGWIIRSLCRDHGLSQGAVARLLSRHKSWVSRRLLLVEGLDEVVQADVRLGLLSPRSAVAVAALPRGNQKQAAALIANRGMTTRQADALVRHLQKLDSDQARCACIESWPDPGSARGGGRTARPHSERELLLCDIATLMRVGVRVEVRLFETPVHAEDVPTVQQALEHLAALCDALKRTLARAVVLSEKVDATLGKSTRADPPDRDAQARRSEPPGDRPSAGRQP